MFLVIGARISLAVIAWNILSTKPAGRLGYDLGTI
jgi:hypothetical protein